MPQPQTPTAPAQQPKEIRKSPRTLKKEAVARRLARYKQAEVEMVEMQQKWQIATVTEEDNEEDEDNNAVEQ